MPADGEVLFLCHRIPYPPNKGDKIRSYHWLKALASRYVVHLGAFIDDPADREHVPAVQRLCATSCLLDLNPLHARVRSSLALMTGGPLTVRYFASRALQRWVDELLRGGKVTRIVVYSSGVAPYAAGREADRIRRILDLCDVDSAKWRQYGASGVGPISWVYSREARTLAQCETRWSDEFDVTIVSSESERLMLEESVGRSVPRAEVLGNGVDTEYFDPAVPHPRPYPDDVQTIVFTGAMDYLANVDAVEWFAGEVWPTLNAQHPTARFVIVGSNPHPRVRALSERSGIIVTGTVPDVRPYLAHACCAVVPLRIARGVQNKVLEALAMDLPVVALRPAMQGISGGLAVPGSVVADDAAGLGALVAARLAPYGSLTGGRGFVERHFAWSAVLERFLTTVEGAP